MYKTKKLYKQKISKLSNRLNIKYLENDKTFIKASANIKGAILTLRLFHYQKVP